MHCVCVIIRFIMAELLQTERTYVKDLETCIKVWFTEFFETIHQVLCVYIALPSLTRFLAEWYKRHLACE